MSAEDPIETMLRSIEEETSLDWDGAVREAGASEPRVAHLRDVQRIAEFNRRLVRSSRARAAAAASGAEPKQWGDLLLLERIGSGAGSDVYRAWDPKLSREIALKLLRDERATGAEPSALLSEGRSIARIRHPHVVAVHSIDVHDGRTGLSMELVRGTTLEREVMSRGALSAGEVVRLGLEIGSALQAVHAADLLHRDVKPANVIKDETGRFVLADFGLGTRGDLLDAARPTGTPMYMAPELLAGGSPSVRTDLYSLGLLLWFALGGRHPYDVESVAALRAAQRRGPHPLLEVRPDIDPNLAAIVERAVTPVAGARFASANEMSNALHGLSRRPAAKRVPLRRAAAMLVSGLAVVAAATLVARRERGDVRTASEMPPVAVVPATAGDAYAIEATFVRRDDANAARVLSGDRVRPGDRLSLELRTSSPAWVYVLNEDERGECYLLFPQPLFDLDNPLPADTTLVLPGTVGGRENAWTVTSQGGREHFLVVASPEPVAELEAELRTLPAPRPGRPIQYASVGAESLERLRGAGGLTELAPDVARVAPRSATFERFRALAGREDDVRGVWVRHIVLENPTE